MLMQGAGAARGARRAGVASDFVITGTDVHVILRKATLRKAQLRSGAAAPRQGAVEAVASLEVTGGAAIAQLYVSTEAPVED